jgi:hypothetical protein
MRQEWRCKVTVIHTHSFTGPNGEQVRLIPGNRIRTFGGWYLHTSVYVNGVRLAGHIQTIRHSKRTETHTCFSPLSSAVIGSDWQWLYRMHREHNDVAVANGFESIHGAQS